MGGRTRAILFGAIVLAGLATPAPAAAASATSHVRGTPPVGLAIGAASGWNWQNPSPHGNTLLAVSCPSASVCYAAGNAGSIFSATGTSGEIYSTTDAGAHWAQSGQLWDTPLTGISCVDATHCTAVGYQGLAISTSNGSVWSGQRVTGTPLLLSVSCTSATTCYAVGAAGFIMSTSDGGTTWTAATSNTIADLNSISCPGATTCIAVGLGGATFRTTGGGVWSALSAGSPGDLYGISCPSTSMCLAVGKDGTANLTTDGGNTWVIVANHNVSLASVSCPDTSHCFGAGVDGQVYFWAAQQSPVGFASTTARGALYGISCPAITTCFAVGEFATIVATSNGATGWTKLATVGENLSGISCPSATACFASGWHIGDVGDIFTTADGGATWSKQTAATAAANNKLLTNVNCVDTTHCTAVGMSGTIINTTDGGASWTGQSSGSATTFLTGVSCPGTLVCFAVGDKGTIVKTVDGGASWAAQASGMTGELTAVSCPTVTRCFASVSNIIDPVMGTTSGPGEIVATSNGGATWALSFNVGNDPSAGPGGQFFSITCPSTTSCYAGGTNGLLAATSDGGANWRTDNTFLSQAVQAISCPSVAVCYAATSGQEVLYTANAGGTWDTQWGGLFGVNLTSIACTGATTCLITDYGGTVARTTTAGAAWSRQMPTGSIGHVHGLACTDAQNCYATAIDSLLSTHNGGTTWTQYSLTTTDQLLSLSCPAAGTCFAVGWPGAIYATSDGGTTWTYQSNPLSGADETLTGVSCSTAMTCVAVGSTGRVLSTTNGTSWMLESSGTTQLLEAVSCATTFNCVAVGNGGVALARSGGTWHAYSSGTTKNLYGVDCPTASVCFAVGAAGVLIKTGDGGGTWTAQASGHTENLYAIRCRLTAVCLAVGKFGTAIITLDGSSWIDDSPTPTANNLTAVAWADLNNAWIGGWGGTILVNNDVTSACRSVTGGPTPASTATVGSVVSISASATGCPNPTYEVWLQPPGGTWTLEQGWSSSSVFSWNSSNAAAGAYRFSVWARDLSSTSSYDSFFAFQYTLTVTACTGISVTGAPSSTLVQRGQPVQFTATSTGCPNPRYEFWLLPPGGSWSLAQAYSARASYYWSTFVPVGTYRFSVWVRDASNANAYDAFSAFPYTIAGTACTSVSASTNPPNTATLGTPVTITGSATGCPYAYYEFWLLPPGGTWKLVQPYSSTLSTYNWSTGWLAPGTYRFSVWAQDGTSPTSYQAFSAFDYTLTGSTCGVATSSSPNGTAAAGTTVTISASTAGCPMSNFEFWLLPPGGAWMLAQPYSANAVFTWNTLGRAPGVYRFSVWARDPTSSASYDAFNAFNYMLTVAPCTAMSATTAPPSTASVGTTVTVTASATGCPNALYEFWVLAPGGTWTLVQAYSTNATFTWNTAGTAAGTYRFSVWARDASSAASYDAFSAFNYALT